MSEKRRLTSIAASKLAVEAIRKRIAGRPLWVCAGCKTEKLATAHQTRMRYCSKGCMADAYRERLRGEANPNYSNAGYKTCKVCSREFHNYSKVRKYCSLACRDKEAQQLRTNAKKDANHGAVVSRLEAGGAVVKDLSRALFGVPDLLVWRVDEWHLVEVKNPKTHYGRQGLNKQQEEWAKNWRGGPVYIIRTDADVDTFLIGELSKLESVGGQEAGSASGSQHGAEDACGSSGM